MKKYISFRQETNRPHPNRKKKTGVKESDPLGPRVVTNIELRRAGGFVRKEGAS